MDASLSFPVTDILDWYPPIWLTPITDKEYEMFSWKSSPSINRMKWEEVQKVMLGDNVDRVILDILLEQGARDQHWKEPIRLGMGISEDDEEFPALLDGTHRFIATKLLMEQQKWGGASIEVTLEGSGDLEVDEMPEEDEFLTLELGFRFPTSISSKDEMDQYSLRGFDTIRSVPVGNEGDWINSDVTGMKFAHSFLNETGSFFVVSTTLGLPSDYSEQRREQLESAIRVWIAKAYPDLVLVGVSWVVEKF